MASYGLVLPEVFPKGTLITDIKQIVTSTDDNGENVIQAELFNGQKVEFKIRNGSKGNTGAAAGFTTPTAEIDNAVGTPSVTVTATGDDTAKKFHFTFKNLKGDKGDRGDLTESVLAVIQNATHDLQQTFKRELYEETKARISGDNAEAQARAQGDKSIVDYGDPSGNRKIQVGYAGRSLQAGELLHLAGYNKGGTKLKDVTDDAVRQLLGLTQKHIVDMIYPIGTVYLTMVGKDPKELFPGTKWKKISEGKYLAGVGVGRDVNKTLQVIGEGEGAGEYFHKLTVSEMPSHGHYVEVCNDGNPDGKRDRSSGADCQYWNTQDNRTNVHYNVTPRTDDTGEGVPHNNMPPYFGVYVWQRIE